MKDALRDLILDYLARNKLMSVATAWREAPWAATVFFAYDDSLQLYFLSERTTRHARNIAHNPKVAATINQDFGKPGLVKGIQLEGITQEVAFTDLPQVFTLYQNRYPWLTRYLPHPALIPEEKTMQRFYRIAPSKIFLLDDERFGKGVRKEYRCRIQDTKGENNGAL
jgi:hypothetical protein